MFQTGPLALLCSLLTFLEKCGVFLLLISNGWSTLEIMVTPNLADSPI